MRNEIIKVQFICEGTHIINGESRLCSATMTLEDTTAMIDHRYKIAGWGWIDEYGLRHLCDRPHVEKRITKRQVGI